MLEIAPIQPRLIRNRLFNVSMRKALPSDRLVSLFFRRSLFTRIGGCRSPEPCECGEPKKDRGAKTKAEPFFVSLLFFVCLKHPTI